MVDVETPNNPATSSTCDSGLLYPSFFDLQAYPRNPTPPAPYPELSTEPNL
jgi:hypothetical protein